MARFHTSPGQATLHKGKPFLPCLDARPQSLSLQTDPGRAGMPQAPSTQLRTSSEVKCRKDKHLSFLTDISDPASLVSERQVRDMEKHKKENGGCEQQ